MNTVPEPLETRNQTAPGGGGGCAGPAPVRPEHRTPQPTCAAGGPSISTCPIPGQGPPSGGTMVPDGTVRSCVTGSPLRAAGNMRLVLRWVADCPRRTSGAAFVQQFNLIMLPLASM